MLYISGLKVTLRGKWNLKNDVNLEAFESTGFFFKERLNMDDFRERRRFSSLSFCSIILFCISAIEKALFTF